MVPRTGLLEDMSKPITELEAISAEDDIYLRNENSGVGIYIYIYI